MRVLFLSVVMATCFSATALAQSRTTQVDPGEQRRAREAAEEADGTAARRRAERAERAERERREAHERAERERARTLQAQASHAGWPVAQGTYVTPIDVRRQQQVTSACLRLVSGALERQRCESALFDRHLAISVLTACAEAFRNSPARLTCVETASEIAVVQSCTQFSNEEIRLACVRDARSADVVSSCIHWFAGAHIELRCVQSSASANVVQECGRSESGTRNKLACLSRARE